MLDPYSTESKNETEIKILEHFINKSSNQFSIFQKNNKVFVFSLFHKQMISFPKENIICLKQEEIKYHETISLIVNENKIVLFEDKNRDFLKRNHDNSLILKIIFEYIFNLIYSESTENKILNN